jgi:hypothetical protein
MRAQNRANVKHQSKQVARPWVLGLCAGLLLVTGIGAAVLNISRGTEAKMSAVEKAPRVGRAEPKRQCGYLPRKSPDTGGFQEVCHRMPAWRPNASLEEDVHDGLHQDRIDLVGHAAESALAPYVRRSARQIRQARASCA